MTTTLTGSEPDPLPQPKLRFPRLTLKRLELLSALILALGGTLTAWAAFEATKWSGLQSIAFSRAAAARTQATEAATKAGQQLLLDAVIFSDWVQAVSAERDRAPRPEEVEGYRPDPSKLSGFFYERFRQEFRPALDAWLATRPLRTPGAPKTPFEMAEYQLESRKEAKRLSVLADEQANLALENNARSDRYVFTTVILASALFFAGVSMKIDARSTRVFLNAVAGVILLVALGLLVSFPVAL